MSLLEQLHPGLQRWMKEQGWDGMRPIQEAAFYPLLEANSCVIEAPTAGGKTEAVLLPILTRVAREPRNSVQVLYLAPLRALLNNLEGRGEALANACGLQAFKWHGDVSQAAKVARLETPPNLLLTTPESLEAILLRKAGWQRFFASLESVIVDEAHNFAAGDRGGHLLALLERLEAGTGQVFQRVAMSATIGNPEAMCRWLVGRHSLAKRVTVAPPGNQQIDYLIHHFDDSGESEATPLRKRAGVRFYTTLSGAIRNRRTIVFVRSRFRAENDAEKIHLFTRGQIRVATHHSAVSRYFREEAERLIKVAGEEGIEAIFSTSTLELGIDIGELDRVLQIGALTSPSAFLQRVGRTGRRPGVPRDFRGLTEKDEDLLLLVASVSLGMEHQSESLRLRRRAFHLLAHQILCLALQEHGVAPRTAWESLRHAYAFSGIRHSEFDGLIQHMCRVGFLRTADGVLVVGEEAERRYLVSGWRRLFAVFDTAPLYEVLEGRTQVGTLDAAFVESLSAPFFFTLAGKLWRAVKVDHESHIVKATPAKEGHAPKWHSFGGPDVPLETAQRAGEFIYGLRELPGILDEAAHRTLKGMQVEGGSWDNGWTPRSILCRLSGGGKAELVTYAGDILNRTLARTLEQRGASVRGRFDHLAVSDGPEDTREMHDSLEVVFAAIRDEAAPASMERVLLGSQPTWRFSRFAWMLPEDLLKAALVDMTTDAEGLRAFFKERNVLFR